MRDVLPMSVDDHLDEMLGIIEKPKKEVVKTDRIVPVIKNDDSGESEIDFQYARENLYHLAERGRDALEDLLELANQSQHPRAYEVVGQLIKTLTDTNDRIVDIQKKAQELLEPKDGPSKVTNNLFVGNTSELTRLLGGNARDVLKKDI